MKPIREQIETALRQLGVTGTVSIFHHRGSGRYHVFVNDRYFGIFDAVKNTFVG